MTHVRATCTGPGCDRKRRMKRLCQRHLDQLEAGQPLTVIPRPMEAWELAEEVTFLLDYGLPTTYVCEALNVTWEALTVRFRRDPKYHDVLDRLTNTLAREQGRDAEAA